MGLLLILQLFVQFKKQMHRRHPHTNSQQLNTYNSMREQLEFENALLMKQRQDIVNEAPQSTQSPNGGHNSYQMPSLASLSGRQSHNQGLVEHIRGKIQDVIECCRDVREGGGELGPLGDIVEAQKKILSYLGSGGSATAEKEEELVAGSTSRQKSTKNNKSTTNQNQSEGFKLGRLEAFRQSIGDEAMQMIEQIERKALQEIETLRMDKINLMKRLNQQIRAHNEEKKKRKSYQGQNQVQFQSFKKPNPHQMSIVDEENEEHSPGRHQEEELPLPSFSSGNSPRNLYAKPQYPLPPQQNNQNRPPEQYFQGQARVPAHGNSQQEQYKSQLRNELSALSAKVQFYQQRLHNTRRVNTPVDMRQFEVLLDQSKNLSQQGNKLLRQKKPDNGNRETLGSYIYEQTDYQPLQASTSRIYNYNNGQQRQERQERPRQSQPVQAYTRPPLQTFSPLDKSSHSFNNKSASGFSPSQYERIIEEMRSATRG